LIASHQTHSNALLFPTTSIAVAQPCDEEDDDGGDGGDGDESVATASD
jgi:hypothetical protein